MFRRGKGRGRDVGHAYESTEFRNYASTLDEDGNTPLHRACAENYYKRAEMIMKRLRGMSGGAEELKKILLLKNYDGYTPIDAAIAAAGDSDSGDASLKLLLGAHIKQLDMLVELFAPDEDKDSGIWQRPGFKLPQLGALLVASNDEKLIDEKSGVELLASAAEYKEFLNEYAELPHEGIGLIVANAFMAEYAERANWERDKPWMKAGGTYGYHSKLGVVFNKCVMLAEDAQQAKRKCDREYRNTEATKFKELAERLQVATATALDNLGNDVAFAVACSVEGEQALNLAVQSSQTVLLSSGAINGVILRKWRGVWLQQLLDRKEESAIWSLVQLLYLAYLIILNVLLLPFAAVTPALAKYRDYGYGRMFPCTGGYLLQTAFFQAGVFASCDFCLTLVLTVHFNSPSMFCSHLATCWYGPYLVLLWAVAALVYELQQIAGRKTSRTAKQGFGQKFRAYLKSDPFNALDLSALCACVLSLCCSSILKLSAEAAAHEAGAAVEAGVGEAVEAGLADVVASAEDQGMSIQQMANANVSLGAVAVLLMWFRQLRLLMIVSSDMAPLIRMMGGMLQDVLNFLQLLVLVLLGFAGALTTLFAEDQSYKSLEPGSECFQLMGPASSFATVLKILFEGSLLGDSPFIACVADSEHPVIGLSLTYGFILFSVVLLLNMIIAMMSKTFDKYYEAATQEAAAQFAGIVQDWEGETNLPAPFNIASLPWYSLAPLLRCFGLFSWSDDWYADDGESRELRMLELGDQPGGKADLEELKDQIADTLQSRFGDHEDTGTLIDHAVKSLQARMEMIEEHIKTAFAASNAFSEPPRRADGPHADMTLVPASPPVEAKPAQPAQPAAAEFVPRRSSSCRGTNRR